VRGLTRAASLAPLLAAVLGAAASLARAQPAVPSPPAAPAPAASPPALGDSCRAGLAHERAGALPRAFIELTRCTAGEAGAEAAAALGRVKKKLAAGKYAPVSFSLTPVEAELRIAPFTDGAPLRDPHTLWLPFGTYTYVATAPGHGEVRGEILVDSPARIHLQVALEPMRRARPPRAVDFEADGPAVDEPIVVADPRPKKLPSLIPKRFRGGLDGEHSEGARRARPAARDTRRRPERAWPWILTRGL